MYGIFTYIWVIFRENVGKYTIHGAYGYCWINCSSQNNTWLHMGINHVKTVPKNGWRTLLWRGYLFGERTLLSWGWLQLDVNIKYHIFPAVFPDSHHCFPHIHCFYYHRLPPFSCCSLHLVQMTQRGDKLRDQGPGKLSRDVWEGFYYSCYDYWLWVKFWGFEICRSSIGVIGFWLFILRCPIFSH